MKLRTELVDGVCCISPSSVDGFDELRHDALAAHALLQAMDEYRDGGECWDFLWIQLRADELMREWTISERSSSPR